jgi:DNA polymerase-3 subunit beta
VQVEYNNTNAYFQTENITLICRLIDGKYPNYVAVIPFDNPNKMVISKQALISSLKRVAVFASASTNQIKFSISGSELQISAEDLDYSNSANERLTCSYDGEDLVIAFNSKFLIEILNSIDTEDISVEMSMPNRPVIILPAKEASDPDEDMLMLVMPVLVNA